VRKHESAAFEKLFRRTISRKVWSWSKSMHRVHLALRGGASGMLRF
jgi:hypothetical protein